MQGEINVLSAVSVDRWWGFTGIQESPLPQQEDLTNQLGSMDLLVAMMSSFMMGTSK